jgi:senataxin
MLKTVFNESQFEAIISATKVTGITLVKGPPGTGKSFVILGVLSTLLGLKPKPKAKTYKKYSIKELEENESSEDEDYNNKTVGKSMKDPILRKVLSKYEDELTIDFNSENKLFLRDPTFNQITPILLKKKVESVDE